MLRSSYQFRENQRFFLYTSSNSDASSTTADQEAQDLMTIDQQAMINDHNGGVNPVRYFSNLLYNNDWSDRIDRKALFHSTIEYSMR